MDFVRYADSVRAKLHMGGARLPVVIGITAVAICVLVAGGAGLASVLAPDSAFTVEKADASHGGFGAGGSLRKMRALRCSCMSEGRLSDPGLYELAGDARVQQAVDAAGGFAEDAAVDAINLAREIQGRGADNRSQLCSKLTGSEDACSGADTGVAGSVMLAWCCRTREGRHQHGNRRSAAAAQRGGPSIGAAYRCGSGRPTARSKPLRTSSGFPGIGDKKYASLADSICVG